MSFIDHLLQPIMIRHYAIPLITCRTPDVPEDLGRSQRRQATSEAKGVGQVHQLSCNGINGFSLVSNCGVLRAIHLRLTVVSKAILVERCTEKRAKDIVDALQE